MLHFIAGSVQAGTGDRGLDVIDPSTGTTVASGQEASTDDLDVAVAAARAAFPAWSAASPAHRSAVLLEAARLMEERADEFARVETSQTGKPIRLSADFDVPGSIDNVAFFGGVARTLEGKAAGEYSGDHTSMVRREPIGVVGSISPWNYPIQMAAWKILPAIAAGNTIVLKPSELTPLTSVMFAEVLTQAGLPDGAVNIVTGPGPTIGGPLVDHPDVAMVSFTGSSAVGRSVMETASRTVKRVHLELGGKAPFVVFDDADLEATIQGAVAGATINAGQDCTAATRAYVHRSIYDRFVEGVGDAFAKVRMGPPTDPATDMGPLISRAHQERVKGFVDRAVAGGARVVTGGSVPGGDLGAGAYYEPTVVVDVAQTDEIVQDEVFGPVLVVLPFDDDDEAIELANDTPYGLAASVWTRDVYRSLEATQRIAAGCVWVNDHIPIISEMPHGGFKGSGFGKDMSTYSLEEYTAVKHVMIDRTNRARKDWHRMVFG